jgi:peroxiredoxin
VTLFKSLVAAAVLVSTPLAYAGTSEGSISSALQNLRSVATDKRPAATRKIAEDIRGLPAGMPKLKLADALVHLSTEGDAGAETMQAVADTLTGALTETPVPAKGDKPPMPYMDLAKLVRYENVKTRLDDPLYTKAVQVLIANDEEIGKADFTLKDLKNKSYTLSELRGKIVMVNFWATWCGPCRLEMPDLDRLYSHFQQQGLVVLSISDEDSFKVASFISPTGYHPPVLLDPGGKVHKLFHIEGIPKTFLFNRDGKLIAEAIDQRSMRQFLAMLSKTDLHP